MTLLDWAVLVATLTYVVLYGMWKTRRARDIEGYFRGGNTLAWPTIGLTVMATQASAITFLSAPGQAYEDGLGFIQIYFGLPLAMLVISAYFLPTYYRLKIFTAYEYLEHRFDERVRYLGASLFLIQRGLAAGITIYAPAIILSTLLGWPLNALNAGLGIVVVVYTVLGGTLAVSQTQKQQMIVMLAGVLLAAALIVLRLPSDLSLAHAIKLAGALDRMNAVSFELDADSRYNLWSGLAGGFFLALAYFGTDQTQVQRYLSGRSLSESRLGLLFNGVFKIPMQFVILLSGVLLFVLHLFTMPPVLFNTSALERVRGTPYKVELAELEMRYTAAFEEERDAAHAYVAALASERAAGEARHALRAAAANVAAVRDEARRLVQRAVPNAETKDGDYIFIGFVVSHVPAGCVGLLIAVILCAAMSGTASELIALGSTTTLDVYRRMRKAGDSPQHYLVASKVFTALWGGVAVAFASFASLLDNLIEAVNILGSIFYGTVLGIFLVALFMERVSATPVLVAAVVAQVVVGVLFFTSDLGFLWYNVVGSAVVVGLSYLLEVMLGRARTRPKVH